jgi:hypothetical protein
MQCQGSGLDPDLNVSVDPNPNSPKLAPKKRKSKKFSFVIKNLGLDAVGFLSGIFSPDRDDF